MFSTTPKEVISECKISKQKLNNTLSILYSLKSNVRQIFEILAIGYSIEDASQSNECQFFLDVVEATSKVYTNLSDLESSVNSLSSLSRVFSLEYTMERSLRIPRTHTFESLREHHVLYSQLVNSFNWIDKVQIVSRYAYKLLNENLLVRSNMSINSEEESGPITSRHNIPPNLVDETILKVLRNLTEFQVFIARPFSSNVVLYLALGFALGAIISFKGLMIEWIVVKSPIESRDIWTESIHHVYRKITENAYAASLNYSSRSSPKKAFKHFLTWFRSYETLFNAPCKICGKLLYNALPPTWRDYSTFEPKHEQCKVFKE